MKKYRMLSLVLALCLCLALLPMPASAAFTPRSTDPKKDSTVYEKYYKYKQLGNPYSDESQCTWYAWGRYKELCGEKLPGWGNAGDWFSKAKSAGYPVGTTPKLGAIACWTPSAQNEKRSHVAVVEAVNGSQITVSQYNEGWSGAFNTRQITLTKTDAWPYPPSGYIYLPGSTSTTPIKTTITFSSLTVPGTLAEGTDAMLDGSFTATNSKICNVKAEVCNASSGAVKLSAVSGGNFSVWTYGPLTNSKLNTDLDLGKLTAGTYYVRYTVTTQDGTTASKSTASFTVTHTWGGWATVKAASCGVAGSRKRTCSRCGQAETQTIAALSHNYQKTGSTAAYDVYTCSNCKDSYRVDTVFWVEIPDENDFRSVGLRNFSDQELSCHFIVAQYENGRLVSLTEKALLLPASSGQYMLTPIPRETGSSTWKVFVLDDQGLTPILPELKY